MWFLKSPTELISVDFLYVFQQVFFLNLKTDYLLIWRCLLKTYFCFRDVSPLLPRYNLNKGEGQTNS